MKELFRILWRHKTAVLLLGVGVVLFSYFGAINASNWETISELQQELDQMSTAHSPTPTAEPVTTIPPIPTEPPVVQIPQPTATEFQKEANINLNLAMANYQKYCFPQSIPTSAACTDAINQLTLYTKEMQAAYGEQSMSVGDLKNQVNQIQQNQNNIDEKLNEEENCLSTHGAWNGSTCTLK